GTSPLSIQPVAIFDRDGRDITPRGARGSRRGRTLERRLNDAQLPLPYVIDPVALVGACGPGTGDFAGCSVHVISNRANMTTSLPVRPSAVATGDLMVAQVTI